MSPRLPVVAASAGFAAVVLVLLVSTAAPVGTDDLWWHLTAGETFLRFGPWPPADPTLHTAHETAPATHEWLFGVLVHGVHAGLGFAGLRALHAALALAGALLAYRIGRRAGLARVPALLAAGALVALAQPRLVQLRPDLVSIPATLLVYRLLLVRETAPDWTVVALAAALTGLWANFHSLFLLGPIFVAVGVAAVAARAAAVGLAPAADRPPAAGLGLRLGAACAAMLAASLVNPRGWDQLLFVFFASDHSDIWAVGDEWSHFVPWSHAANHVAVTGLQWVVADVAMAGFAAAAVLVLWRFVRDPARGAPGIRDAVDFSLGLASVVALLISIRFLWLAWFPLLFALRVLAGSGPRDPAEPAVRAWAAALGLVAIAAAVLRTPAVIDLAERFAARPGDYLTTPYRTYKYHVEGMRFLAETGLTGNLFNSYWMGGFAGYWLAPRLKTFIEGRTADVTREVIVDHHAVLNHRAPRPGETMLDVLDRYRVDVFFGVGYPGHRYPDFTTVHLERTDGWLLVSRSYRHAIYVRDDEQNRGNVERVARYYARLGVPFDRRRGLVPDRVIESGAPWAAERFLVPADHDRLLAAADGADPAARRRSRELLAVIYLLGGAYELQVAMDRETVRRFPGEKGPRRRLVYGLLRLDRTDEATAEARSLVALDLADRWSLRMLETALEFDRLSETEADPRRRRVRRNALLWWEFPASRGETRRVEGMMRSETLAMPARTRAGAGPVGPGQDLIAYRRVRTPGEARPEPTFWPSRIR